MQALCLDSCHAWPGKSLMIKRQSTLLSLQTCPVSPLDQQTITTSQAFSWSKLWSQLTPATWNCTIQHALPDNSNHPHLHPASAADRKELEKSLTKAVACSSWRLQGQRQQRSKNCLTRRPSNYRYLKVLAVQKLMGGQHLVPVLSFRFVFCGGASKYHRRVHLQTTGNCHRNGVAINEEWYKYQSLSAFKLDVYLEILC